MNTALRYRWSRLNPTTQPSPHFGSSMVYDTKRQQVMLVTVNAVWLWNGTNWDQAQIPFPARNSTHLVYDAGAQCMLLFGGIGLDGTPLNDTWLWDGSMWREQHPANTPPPLGGAAITYDPLRQQVTLFGGITGFDGSEGSNRVGTLLSETWTWDGTTWAEQQVNHAPTERVGAQMIYDEAHHQILLFGGSNSNGHLNEMWSWNGTDWTKVQPAKLPPARTKPLLVFHTQAQQVLLTGGVSQSGRFHDVWLWDGAAWSQASSTDAPPTGSIEGMAYDETHQVVLAYVVSGSKPDLGDKKHPKPIILPPVTLVSETWTWG